jgi:hypothetical protein
MLAMKLVRKISTIIKRIIWLIFLLMALQGSAIKPADSVERVRAYTRSLEFDYATWVIDALGIKLAQASAQPDVYMDASAQKKLVLDYLDLLGQHNRLRSQVADLYADPEVADPLAASASLRARRDEILSELSLLAPVAEAVLQGQLAMILSEEGLTVGGQAVPPVLYHVTELPYALIVSPRETIRQDADISLLPGLSLEEQVQLEDRVAQGLDVSALVVPVGGIGVYPTMVMSTTDLNWLAEVVAHEWVHNFLTTRPLGMSYGLTEELRSINETTASLAGRELGTALISRYYPERVPPPPALEENPPTQPEQPEEFNFRKAMHETRVQVDSLLGQGKVAEAESYMESRRQFFWENGYRIRRLNQAYFAFYGAYNDLDGGASGAAGADPIGPAIARLRANSGSLAKFLNRISWMTSFNQLQKAAGAP